jgi:hypothetical protein
VADSESRTFLKIFRDGAAPVSVLVSFAEVRGRPRRTGPGRSSRSQTTLTCRERTSTDLESVLAATAKSPEKWNPTDSSSIQYGLTRRQDGATVSDPVMLAEYVVQYPKIFVL